VRFEPPLPIAGVACWLPAERETAAFAVAEGRLDATHAADQGYQACAVSELAPPVMAVLAATAALGSAGWDPATVDLLLHAWTYYQGHDFWSPPHFVADQVGASAAIPVGVQQMCNGGAAAVELAAARLLVDPSVTRAVVTTADRFAAPGFDRWSGDYGTSYGDGATALLLSAPEVEPAPPLRLLAITTVAVPSLESAHRGGDPFSPAPRMVSSQVDSRRTLQHFMAAGGGPVLAGHAAATAQAVLTRALAEAGIDRDSPRLRVVALPRLGREVLDDDYPDGLPVGPATEVSRPGADTGHLGAGDPFANLADLHAAGTLGPGEVAVLLSVGAGFTWSALVVEVP
jgi:3-oxoacyl-[acyl-carrier-protein] synthase III